MKVNREKITEQLKCLLPGNASLRILPKFMALKKWHKFLEGSLLTPANETEV